MALPVSPVKPYELDVIPLTEGLDFNTATSLSKPGSLRDVLNYEFVDGAGLKRINGTVAYDGNDRYPIDKPFYITTQQTGLTAASTKCWLYVESDDNPNKVPFGYSALTVTALPTYDSDASGTADSTVIPFIRLECPSFADPAYARGVIKDNQGAITINAGYSILSLDDLPDPARVAVFGTSSTTAVNEHTTLLGRTQQSSFPYYDNGGTVEPINSVWTEKMDGITYQIGDAMVYTGTAAKQIYPGDYCYFSDGIDPDTFSPMLVLEASVSGSWAGGTATVTLVGINHQQVAEINTRTPAPIASVEANLHLYRSASTAAITSGTKVTPETVDACPSIAVMYKAEGDAVANVNSNISGFAVDCTGGTQYNLTSDAFAPSTGDAEFMPLISSGVVGSVVCTKNTTEYATAPGVVIDASTGTAITSPGTAYTNRMVRTGWIFHHTGWKIPFREGNRKYGYLNKIDRYKDIDGSTYSASSSVTGLEATRAIGSINSRATGITAWPIPSSSGNRWLNFGLWNTQNNSIDNDAILTSINTADATNYIYQQLSVTPTSLATTKVMCLSGFGGLSAIPEGSSVKGVKITAVVDDGGTTTTIPTNLGLYAVLGIVRANEVGGFVEKAYGNRQEFLTAGGANLQSEITGGMASTTFTAGGTSNLFGSGGIPIEELLDPDFSIGIFIETDATTATSFQVKLDHITLEVTYELPSVRLYFKSNATSHSGGDIITIHGDLVDYVVSGGDFRTGDAEGTLTVVNLRTITANTSAPAGLTLADSSVPYYTVMDDMDIYLDSGLTVKVGEVDSTMTFNDFDSYKTIKQNDSRYTSTRANFFANDEYDAFYICSGAGRAGIFDGRYWSRIFAINPKQANSATLDKPRHVGVNNFHLFLGYRSGSCLFSAPGDPSNFSAFDGAGEIGIGDRINGFNRLQGNAFGVFCEESVHAITGTDADTFASQVIVPSEGALEYSVASFGNRVIYTSKTGITTLDQSEKYGNFMGRRLSFDVNPWLVPRISGGAGLFTQITDFSPVFESGNGFVCAYAVPHHNQYRVWFKDGLQLWLTLVSDESPKCTFVKYISGYTTGVTSYVVGDPFIPNYVTVTGDVSKSPVVLMCLDKEYLITELPTEYPSLYRLDFGDSFDAGQASLVRGRLAIPHYALINYQYLKNPFTTKTLRKVRLEGQTRGTAPLAVYAENGYKASAQEVRTVGTNISLPRTPLDEIRLSYKPESTLANVAATGRVLSILLVGESLARDPYYTTTGTGALASTRTTVPTPSHYLQALLVQFEEGKDDA